MDWKSMMGALLAAGTAVNAGSAMAATAAGGVTVRVTPERQSLAKSDDVLVNADSHEYFGENTPAQQ